MLESQHYKLLPLIEVPHLQQNCINLLNEEWPKSASLRERSIKKCLNSFPPMSLVLLDITKNDLLVGHARLCLLPKEENACWLESVVVSQALRGLGIGRILMIELEKKVLSLGIKKIFLSTEDKEIFYKKCGYSITSPIINVGSNLALFKKYSIFLNQFENNESEFFKQDKTSTVNDQTLSTQENFLVFPTPPPPPPSFNLFKNLQNDNHNNINSKILPKKVIYMSKILL